MSSEDARNYGLIDAVLATDTVLDSGMVYFDARLSPRLAIDSGERVTISSVSGGPELMPGPPLIVPPALGPR